MASRIQPAKFIREWRRDDPESAVHRAAMEYIVRNAPEYISRADAAEQLLGDQNPTIVATVHHSVSNDSRCGQYIYADARTNDCRVCWVDSATSHGALNSHDAITYTRVFDIVARPRTLSYLRDVFEPLGYSVDMSRYIDTHGETIQIYVSWKNLNYNGT